MRVTRTSDCTVLNAAAQRFRRDANSLLLYCDNCRPNCRLDTYTAQNRSRTDRQYADTHTEGLTHV